MSNRDPEVDAWFERLSGAGFANVTEPMITVGVDLAASARNTAACEIHWYSDHAVVERVDTTVDDAAFLALLETLPESGRLGLDCPLGWPVAFVSAVRAHHDHAPWPARGRPDRAELVWRATDRWIRQRGGRWPLSVSTDRIGVTALRAAYLLDACEAAGGTVDRSGVTGPLVEVYPAVARRLWAMESVRSIDEVEARLPIRFNDSAARLACQASEHVFDAMVSALVGPRRRHRPHRPSTRGPPGSCRDRGMDSRPERSDRRARRRPAGRADPLGRRPASISPEPGMDAVDAAETTLPFLVPTNQAPTSSAASAVKGTRRIRLMPWPILSQAAPAMMVG